MEEGRRLARLEADLANVAREFEALSAAGLRGGRTHAPHRGRREAQPARSKGLSGRRSRRSRATRRRARPRPGSRGPLAEAERAAQRLETEVRTLVKLLGSGGDRRFPPVVDTLTVARGLEAALGAALGDDLDAPADEAAPAHWSVAPGPGQDPVLPPGAEPLAAHVAAPAALARRLAQIGVVSRAEGKRLSARLLPGQRLVSREGDLWRWDGFVAAADAPTPAARRLAEKNRLADLEAEAGAARRAAETVRIAAVAAANSVTQAAAVEAQARQNVRAARAASDAAREALWPISSASARRP